MDGRDIWEDRDIGENRATKDADVELVLACPQCERRHPIGPGQDAGVVRVACSLCQTGFTAELVRVVETRSSLDRQTGTRRFRVRVGDAAGAERVLGIGSYSHAAFPLAIGEWAIVARVGGQVRAVQDPPAKRFMKVRPTRGAWLSSPAPAWGAAVAGVMAAAVVAARAWSG